MAYLDEAGLEALWGDIEELVDGVTISDGGVTTAKLADGAVTDAKLAQSGGVLEKVDDLKSALDLNSSEMFGMIPVIWNEGHSIGTSGDTATDIMANQFVDCAVIDCSEGDRVFIIGNGGNVARLWAFADSLDNILSASDANVSNNGTTPIIAPADTSKLIVNVLKTSPKKFCYIETKSRFLNIRGTVAQSNLLFTDANDIDSSCVYVLSSTLTSSDVAHLPDYGIAGIIITYYNKDTGTRYQTVYYRNGITYLRWANESWLKNSNDLTSFTNMGHITNYTLYQNNAKHIIQPGAYWIGSTTTQNDIAGLPKYGAGCVLAVFRTTFSGGMGAIQIAYYTDGTYYSRLLYGTGTNPTTTIWHSNKSNVICVKSDGTGDYSSVVEAVSNASDGDIIEVYPGIYNGTIRALEKNVNIIGVDKNTCIIRSTDGGYRNPAMEATSGHFENLTFESKYVSGTSTEIGSTTSGAYAVHCESSMDSGFGVGKTISFVNCRLISDFFPALGCGASADWKMELNNCELISNQPYGRGNYSTDSSGSLGAIYFHDQAGNTKGRCDVLIKDCIIRSTQLKNTMCIYDLGGSDNNCNLAFINNTLYSATDGFNNSIWWRGVSTPFGNIIHLVPYSHGNTETELNA